MRSLWSLACAVWVAGSSARADVVSDWNQIALERVVSANQRSLKERTITACQSR